MLALPCAVISAVRALPGAVCASAVALRGSLWLFVAALLVTLACVAGQEWPASVPQARFSAGRMLAMLAWAGCVFVALVFLAELCQSVRARLRGAICPRCARPLDGSRACAKCGAGVPALVSFVASVFPLAGTPRRWPPALVWRLATALDDYFSPLCPARGCRQELRREPRCPANECERGGFLPEFAARRGRVALMLTAPAEGEQPARQSVGLTGERGACLILRVPVNQARPDDLTRHMLRALTDVWVAALPQRLGEAHVAQLSYTGRFTTWLERPRSGPAASLAPPVRYGCSEQQFLDELRRVTGEQAGNKEARRSGQKGHGRR